MSLLYALHCSELYYYVTMCSMNILQAPNHYHLEVLIGVDWATCIIEDSPYSNVWGNKMSRVSKSKVNIANSVISSSNYVVLYVQVYNEALNTSNGPKHYIFSS